MIFKGSKDVRRNNPPDISTSPHDYSLPGGQALNRASRRFVLFSSATLLLVGCGHDQPKDSASQDPAAADSISRARQDSINRTLPGYVVDSILPVDEELRRFKESVGGEKITMLQGGASSRDSLAQKFLKALQASDTSALREMVLNAREFAWLVYPESPYTKPPYTQSPALVWNQITNPSASGFTRLIRRLGGKTLAYTGYTCSKKADQQGQNIIWTICRMNVGEPGEKVRARRLFGSIIERDGQFKLVSFANDF